MYRASNLGFPFRILSHSFGSGTESLGSRLHRIHHNIHAISHLLEKHPVQWVTLYKVYCKSPNNLGTTKNNYNPQRCLVWSKYNFKPLGGAPCLERCLLIRVILKQPSFARFFWCFFKRPTSHFDTGVPATTCSSVGKRSREVLWLLPFAAHESATGRGPLKTIVSPRVLSLERKK